MGPLAHRLSVVAFLLVILVPSPGGADTFICGNPDSISGSGSGPTFQRFYPYRSGTRNFHLIWRDVEFMWDSLYAAGSSDSVALTMRALARSLVDSTGKNPFGTPVSDMNLIYEYFRREGPTYNLDPADTVAMRIGYYTHQDYGGELDNYKPSDRSHADCYIFNAAERPGLPGGTYPSHLYTDDEDVSSDREVRDVRVANTLKIGGPSPERPYDIDGTGWASPDSLFIVGFNHEFQHSLPPYQGLGTVTASFSSELFSAAAEAIGGNADTSLPIFDVPYTWSLLGETPSSVDDGSGPCIGKPSETCVRALDSNYQGRTLFATYLAYNFRGSDTTATLTGMQDDLVRRWARSSGRNLHGLQSLLQNDSCGTCSTKAYFHPGGVPLDSLDRMALLHHNWRVANYVNNSTLDEGQYGYPPQFGFSPSQQVGAWQNLDGSATDDIVAIPPEVTLDDTHRVEEMVLKGERSFQNNSYPLVLQPFGSEYWVVKSESSIWTPAQDLVVRVTPEDLHFVRKEKLFCGTGQFDPDRDARLVASVVAYSPPSGSVAGARLWEHPEWAARAFPPKWVDVDSIGSPLEFVVPSFGDSFKAVVVVLSLANGPAQYYGGSSFGFNGLKEYVEALHYRINLGLRTAPFQQTNPLTLSVSASEVEDSPTWSADGAEVAYAASSASIEEIRRKRLTGGSAQTLTTGRSPDWSPRGNLIAFVRDSASAGSRVWLYDTLAAQASQLTFMSGDAASPAFSPNGQQIAYARSANDFPPETGQENAICVSCGWELRRVNVDGTNDTLLLRVQGEFGMRSTRWLPGGQWIFLKKQETAASGLPGTDQHWVVAADGTQGFTRTGLLDDAETFDLHRGSGPLLLGQFGGIPQLFICQNLDPFALVTTEVDIPFQRIAVRDTLSVDTDPRFYRTGATFFNPRWSPDGSRIAYSSNQNSGGSDRDLFIGQVSFNHPPGPLNLPPNIVVHTGRPYTLDLNASDPDGETVTYRAPFTFRPPGTTFTQGSGIMQWASPGPVCAEYYTVFRALDGSGGVSSQVVRFTAAIDSVDDFVADIVGDNDVWVTWTAPGDTGALGRGVEYDLRYAQVPLNEANFETGSRVTGMAAPGVPGANESQGISGLSAGTAYYIAIRTKDMKDNWSVLSTVLQVTTTSGGAGGGSSAQEVRAPLTGIRAAQTAVSRPGGGESTVSVLAVEMAMESGAPTWSIRQLNSDEALALGSGDTTSVLLQGRDEAGAWTDRLRISHEKAGWRYAVRGLHRPGRIVFIGSYGVRQAWNSVERDGRGGTARLVTAQHSRLGDVKGGFDSRGIATLEVNATDSLNLAYEWLDQDSETAQDWFLLVGPPGSEVSTPLKARSVGGSEDAPLPTRFALRQNQPNPFSGRTAIHFELPVETSVRLDVFDAQGRLVRTLVEGLVPAGFHAVEWDHRSDGGQALGAGVYLYRIHAGPFREQRKMVLLGR